METAAAQTIEDLIGKRNPVRLLVLREDVQVTTDECVREIFRTAKSVVITEQGAFAQMRDGSQVWLRGAD